MRPTPKIIPDRSGTGQPAEPLLRVSAVVSTLGRTTEVTRLLESLEAQSCPPHELVVVDQNPDDRLSPILNDKQWSVPLVHLRCPGSKGLSRGRNEGWRVASGELVIFPDDDCWYPSWLFEEMTSRMKATGVDILAGRAADSDGRSINGRFSTEAGPINRSNVWNTQIEWMVMFRRTVLEKVGGYNVDIGVGASTPWQACEGQDILLRSLEVGASTSYDPALFGHHPEILTEADAKARAKARAYARGHGYVLRKHGFRYRAAAYWTLRPLCRAGLSLFSLELSHVALQIQIAIGRLEGFGRPTVIPPGFKQEFLRVVRR